MQDSNYTNVILEELRGQMAAVLEIVSKNQDAIEQLPTRREFSSLQDDVTTIKRAVTDTGKDLQLQERRLTALEAKG